MKDVATKQFVVIGLGMTGLSVVRHLKRLDKTCSIKVIDTRPSPPGADQLPEGVALHAGGWHLDWLTSADVIVDDIAINANEWRAKIAKEYGTGLICGAFDIIHPGYIDMFADIKSKCAKLLVALQDDPTVDRPEKDKPVQSFSDRKKILMSIKYIDEVVEYNTEAELYEILKSQVYDVRVLGTDYKDKNYLMILMV